MNRKALERCRKLIEDHIIKQYSNIDYRTMSKCDFKAKVIEILHKLWEKGIIQQYGMTLNVNFLRIVCNALRRNKEGTDDKF